MLTNQVSPRWGTPLETLARKFKYTDQDLAPIYDVFFAHPGIDLLLRSRGGRSPLEAIRLWSDQRADCVARMETYVKQAHGSTS